MLFFARLWVAIIGLVPEKWQSTEFMRNVRVFSNYYYFRGLVIAWHQAELERLDLGFGLQQACLRLVAAREEAHAKGIGPLDPKYPALDLFHIPRSTSKMSRTNK
jgi:hypothetical protein